MLLFERFRRANQESNAHCQAEHLDHHEDENITERIVLGRVAVKNWAMQLLGDKQTRSFGLQTGPNAHLTLHRTKLSIGGVFVGDSVAEVSDSARVNFDVAIDDSQLEIDACVAKEKKLYRFISGGRHGIDFYYGDRRHNLGDQQAQEGIDRLDYIRERLSMLAISSA